PDTDGPTLNRGLRTPICPASLTDCLKFSAPRLHCACLPTKAPRSPKRRSVARHPSSRTFSPAKGAEVYRARDAQSLLRERGEGFSETFIQSGHLQVFANALRAGRNSATVSHSYFRQRHECSEARFAFPFLTRKHVGHAKNA